MPASLVQVVGGKHCPHDQDHMQSRDDNMMSEFFKTLVDLHICAGVSGLIDKIGMWLDLEDENWVSIPFHDIDCGEVNALPGLKQGILGVHPKPILILEKMLQEHVVWVIPFGFDHGIGFDSIKLNDD